MKYEYLVPPQCAAHFRLKQSLFPLRSRSALNELNNFDGVIPSSIGNLRVRRISAARGRVSGMDFE